MLTRPADLPEVLLREALADGWHFRTARLRYQAVGFGSHHWLAEDAGGERLFVTVDDLDARRRSEQDTTDEAFGRLAGAFESALSLSRDAALDFVVAPVPAGNGLVLRRLTTRYSLVVHPYLAGCESGTTGEFETGGDRLAVIGLLAELHSARRAVPPPADGRVIPNVAGLLAAMASTGDPWPKGPYGERSRALLASNAADLTVLLSRYRELAGTAARTARMVITHGEPSASNVLKTPAGAFLLVDWESALLAPPERDLWALAETDPSVLAAYTAATGTVVDSEMLALYRMWYDLFEIAGYIRLFRASHEESEDSAESWENLQYFLRPADRWPELFARRR